MNAALQPTNSHRILFSSVRTQFEAVALLVSPKLL